MRLLMTNNNTTRRIHDIFAATTRNQTRRRDLCRLFRKQRIAILFVMLLCIWLVHYTRKQASPRYSQVFDAIVLGESIPKSRPLRFLYYQNILTLCDCPYLPQGAIPMDDYAETLFSLLGKNNSHNRNHRPWEAIYAMPGISHARTNLACLLQEATLLGAIAVLPPVCLSPIHNNDHRLIRTHWSRYLYIDKLQQGFPLVWNISLLEDKLLWFPEYANISHPLRRNACDDENIFAVPFSKKYQQLVAFFSESTPTQVLQSSKAIVLVRQFLHTNQEYKICSSLLNDHQPWLGTRQRQRIENVWSYFWSSGETDPLPAVQYIQHSLFPSSNKQEFFCLHLRRGDKLNEPRYPCLDKYTRGPHIYSVLRNASVPCGMKIYVLTNEKDPQVLDSLLQRNNNNNNNNSNCEYRWIYRQHIPYLQQSKYIQDNYLLYETEKRICPYAVGYVETHRTNPNYRHLSPWNLRLTPYEEECSNNQLPECQCSYVAADYEDR